MTSKFRVQAKRLFITWPHCDVPLDEILHQIKAALNHRSLSAYLICSKTHANGILYRQAYVYASTAMTVASCRSFDIRCNGVTFHPNIRRVRGSLIAVLIYLRKSDSYICNTDEKKHWAAILAKAKAGDALAAYADATRLFPQDVVLYGSQIRYNLNSLASPPPRTLQVHPSPDDDPVPDSDPPVTDNDKTVTNSFQPTQEDFVDLY